MHSLVLAARLRPRHSAGAPSNKSEGARNAGGPADPRAPMPRGTGAGRQARPGRRPDGENRKSAFSPTTRARCLRLALHGPRDIFLHGRRQGGAGDGTKLLLSAPWFTIRQTVVPIRHL